MNWLIENFDEDFAAVADIASKYGTVIKHPCDHFDPIPHVKFVSDDLIFCYGSLQWVKEIQDFCKSHAFMQSATNFVTMCNFDNYHCSKYYAHLGQFLFNRHYMMMPLAEVARRKEELFHQFSSFFIRPSTGFKTGPVSGVVLTDKNFDEEYSFFLEDFGPDGLMIVAPPRHIDVEWRTIICRGKPITGCQYRTYCPETNKLGVDFDKSCPQDVLLFAEQVASVWQPDEMFCLDVVKSAEHLYLMEINALSTSGWYDCDVDKILQAIMTCYEGAKNA